MKIFCKLCLILVILTCNFCGFAHAHNITDSLNNVLKQGALSDSVKLQLHKLLAEEIRATSPYKALQYIQKAIEIAEKTKSYSELADCFIIKSIIYQNQGNYSFALGYLLNALEISEQHHLQVRKMEAEKWISRVYEAQKNYQQAIDFANKSLHSSEELRDRKQVAKALSNIALIHLDKKDYQKSIYYFNKLIPILKALNEKQLLADSKINLLNVYVALQNYTKAIELCDEAYGIYEEINWSKGKELAFINYAEIYALMGNIPKSLDYYQQALVIQNQLDNNINKVFTLNAIAKLYLDNQQLTEAELYAEQALHLGKQIDAKIDIKNSYNILYQIYKFKGLSTKALYYYELERQINDSIFNFERDRLLVNMQKNYELEKQVIEIAKLHEYQVNLSQEVQKQMTIKNMFMSSFLLVVVLLFFLWKNNKQKRSINQAMKTQQSKILAQSASFKILNQELHDQKSKIEQLNSELEKRINIRTNELALTVDKLVEKNQDLADFSHIVSHNLRAPIATLKGLVDMHKMTNYSEEPEMIALLISHIDKSMRKFDAVVHDLNTILSVRESISKVYEMVDLQDILWDVINTRLASEMMNSNAILTTNFLSDANFLGIKSYIENIIYQLISNAIKYKDTEKKLTIHVTVSETGNNEICLSVKDNGLGVPNPAKLFQFHQRQHIHIEGTGLGLYLIATQLKVMNGRTDVISEKGKGSEFLIYFKKT